MDLALIFGGVVVSVVVQLIKNYFGTNTLGTLLAVLVLSLVGAGAAVTLQHFNLWASFLQLVITAGATYAFILQNVPSLKTMGTPAVTSAA